MYLSHYFSIRYRTIINYIHSGTKKFIIIVFFYLRSLSPKAWGSNSEVFITLVFPFLFTISISISPQRSLITCLQAPQGEMKPSVSQAMAIALNFLSPSEMALNIDVLSAHIVKLYELDSTLHPV